MYLAMQSLDKGYADPRWGGYRQIQEAGGHVRKGEKGTPIMYVDFRQRRTARDEQGNPVRDEEGRPKLEWVQRDRPLVKLHYVFNVEQTEGLKLRSLETAVPQVEGARAGRGADQRSADGHGSQLPIGRLACPRGRNTSPFSGGRIRSCSAASSGGAARRRSRSVG